MLKPFAALLILLAAAGCTSVEDARPPTVELANIRLGQPGLLSQQFELDLRVGNPNDFALPLEGLSFRFEVNGQPFAEGLSNRTVTVPRLGYATVPVTASANILSVLRQIMTLGESQTVRYRLSGDAFVGGGFGRRTVPFERDGELSLAPPAGRREPPGVRTLAPVGGVES